jgi:hypothetical protein
VRDEQEAKAKAEAKKNNKGETNSTRPMVEGSSNLGAPSSPQGNPSLEITSHSLNGLKLFYPFKVKIIHNVGFIYL